MDGPRPAFTSRRSILLDETVVGGDHEVSWVVSNAANAAQMRFCDRVEGSVCLRPSWAEYGRLARPGSPLAGLVPGDADPSAPRDPPGKAAAGADPGSVICSSYQCLFPAAVLLSEATGVATGDPLRAAPRILVVGLGAGAGVVLLAHHWRAARITVVEVDARVVDLATRNYPLLRWLAVQPAWGSSSERRVEILVQDVREFLGSVPRTRGEPARYDAVILDAFTLEGGVPDELTTRAFYSGVADRLLTEGGAVMSNVLGSYEGPRADALPGVVERMALAGLAESHNFPMPSRSGREFHPVDGRNNLLISARSPLRLGPGETGATRLRRFTLYPDVPAGCAVAEELVLGRANTDGPPWAAPVPVGTPAQRLAAMLRARAAVELRGSAAVQVHDPDLAEVLAGDVAHRFAHRLPADWRRQWTGEVTWRRTDYSTRGRALFADVVAEAARTDDGGRTLVHGGGAIARRQRS